MFAVSWGRFGDVSVVRASTAWPLPDVQKRAPQSGPVLRIGSFVLAARPAAAKNPLEPTPTIGILCALLAGTNKQQIIASDTSAAMSLDLVIIDSPQSKFFEAFNPQLPHQKPACWKKPSRLLVQSRRYLALK
jgi:hypothetical protein